MKRNTVNTKVQFGYPGRRSPEGRNRTIERLRERPRILIVCEGEKTEPNYFRAFRVTNNVFGEGLETIRVVEEAERLNEVDGPFDRIWCVFDRDSFPADNFDNAVKKGAQLGQQGISGRILQRSIRVVVYPTLRISGCSVTSRELLAKINWPYRA